MSTEKWKENVESKGMRVNMNKTKVMISGEHCLQCFDAVGWAAGRASGL